MERVQSRMFILSWVLPVIPLLLALVGTASVANAAEGSQKLCVNPSGLTRTIGANEECRSNETPYAWPASGGQGGTLTVIDFTGKIVGPLLSSEYVALTANGRRFRVGVGPMGFRNFTNLSLYYTSSGCPASETPLIQVDNNPLLPLLLVTRSTGYFANGQSSVNPFPAYRRSYDPVNDVFVGCVSASPGPLTSLGTLTLPAFATPFSIK